MELTIAVQFSFTQQSMYLDPHGQLAALPGSEITEAQHVLPGSDELLCHSIGSFFVFDLSPFVVKVDNDRMPLTHFLTKICAIVGGVVSVRVSYCSAGRS